MKFKEWFEKNKTAVMWCVGGMIVAAAICFAVMKPKKKRGY